MFIECFFYWAVPCFFMITGATLIDYRNQYDTKTYFQKRFWRSVVPFLFWSIVWIAYTKIYRGKNFLDIVDIIINSRANGVYWFFPALFSVYIAIPVFGLIRRSKKILTFKYIVFISLLTVSTLPMIFSLLKINYNYSFTSLVGGGYIVYTLLGYLLVYHYNFPKLSTRIWFYLAGLIGFAARVITVLIWSLEDGKINNTLGGYLGLPTVALSVAIFIFCQYDLLRLFKLSDCLKQMAIKISSCSLGVYLIHMYFIGKLPRLFHFAPTSIWWRTFGVLAVYLICVITVMVLKKIPIIKKIVP